MASSEAGGIVFRREPKVARLHDPRRNFALTEVQSEIRYDPLTGGSSRICHFALPAAPPPDIEAIAAARRPTCPFCPERVMTVTPRFPDALVPGGRFRRGDSVVFPNLFPYDDLSTVLVPGREHLIAAGDVPESFIVAGLGTARDFLAATLPRLGIGDLYGLVTWNHMPPAGGTQLHPHLQVVATSEPGNAIRRELAAESAYLESHRRPFAPDLIDAEASGGRVVGRTGDWTWVVPFAPSGVLGDCRAILPGKASVLDLTDEDVAAFASGLRRALRGFAAAGLWSFNLTFFPDRTGERSGRHALSARLLPRMYIDPVLHVPDANYLNLLLGEHFSMAWPEEVAARLRHEFTSP
jgi:UDPglucose--hexose-1-phosphate uridylyltransferase